MSEPVAALRLADDPVGARALLHVRSDELGVPRNLQNHHAFPQHPKLRIGQHGVLAVLVLELGREVLADAPRLTE
jgi:hypothetical protein